MSEPPIKEVTVRKWYAYWRHWLCKPTSRGWKCGHCLRGNLGHFPKVGDVCKVCKATVCEVVK